MTNSTTDDDIEAAIAYHKAHAKVQDLPERPEPTPVSRRPDLQDAAKTELTDEDVIATIKLRHREIAKDMPKGYVDAFNDLEPYLEDIFYERFSIAEVAAFVKVNRSTVWRWLKQIDATLVKPRRESVNVSEVSDDTALAVYIDSVYKKLRRGELTEKYNIPDKTIQALIARGRAVNEARLKQAHRRQIS